MRANPILDTKGRYMSANFFFWGGAATGHLHAPGWVAMARNPIVASPPTVSRGISFKSVWPRGWGEGELSCSNALQCSVHRTFFMMPQHGRFQAVVSATEWGNSCRCSSHWPNEGLLQARGPVWSNCPAIHWPFWPACCNSNPLYQVARTALRTLPGYYLSTPWAKVKAGIEGLLLKRDNETAGWAKNHYSFQVTGP